MNSKQRLLTRDQFREGVFARDNHRCVICGDPASRDVLLDAHHIMERKLWIAEHEFGGYFLDNGATLCDRGFRKRGDGSYSCHLQAGMTLISPARCREAAGIKTTHLPEHLYADQEYTVWGDPVMANGQRMRGELFFDEGAQLLLKLAGLLGKYTHYVRHPRTYHLPFSPKVVLDDLGDDKVMPTTHGFEGQRVIATVKMDGGQFTLYHDYMHARTTNFRSDPTTSWLQQLHATIKYDIPPGYRLNVESLWTTHAIQYNNLPSYAMAWMLWDDRNNCCSWDDTREYVELLGAIPLVPVLYDGIWDEEKIKALYTETYNGDPMEGFVVRLADSFHYKGFQNCVAKYVRGNHQPRHGGVYRDVVRNKLKGE